MSKVWNTNHLAQSYQRLLIGFMCQDENGEISDRSRSKLNWIAFLKGRSRSSPSSGRLRGYVSSLFGHGPVQAYHFLKIGMRIAFELPFPVFLLPARQHEGVDSQSLGHRLYFDIRRGGHLHGRDLELSAVTVLFLWEFQFLHESIVMCDLSVT